MQTSPDIQEITKSLSKLQGAMRPAAKDSQNPYFKSKYTSLSACWDSIREFMDPLGLCILQDAKSTENGVSVVTRICHASGQWIEFGPLEMPVLKKDPQAFGSVVSYAKRYALTSALGIVSDDDDAEKAMNRYEHQHIEYISKAQSNEILALMDTYPDIKMKIEEFLKKQNAKSLTNLPAHNYEKILKSIKKYVEELSSGVTENGV